MTRILRALAFVIAIAAVVDPVFAVRRSAPLPVDLLLPPASEPTFAAAVALRESVIAGLADSVRLDSGEAPRAIIAIGDVKLHKVPDVPVFALPVRVMPYVYPATGPTVSNWWGQQAVVSPTFHAKGTKGKTTTFTVAAPGGARVGSVRHQWTNDEESFAPAFVFAPPAPGVAVLRVTAETDAVAPAAVDVTVTTSPRRARVLVFEPRPTWAAGFVRQALESDPLFDVQGFARTSRGIVTRTGLAPESLSSLDPDSVDLVVVGGLDALTAADSETLRSFAEVRGGIIVFIPDARIPESVKRAFRLPDFDDVLHERPIELRQGAMRIRASEVLRHRGTAASQDLLVVEPRVRGQILVSLALDAWRYRGDPNTEFNALWRAVAAEASMAAAAPISIRIEPSIVRPGDEVAVVVTSRNASQRTVVRGTMASAQGEEVSLRFWPGTIAAEFVARFVAPPPGRYDLRVDVEGFPRHDAVLVVNENAQGPAIDRGAELEFVARTTGGEVFQDGDVANLVRAMRAQPAAAASQDVRPTRSRWWMLAFAVCVCGEWAIRRKQGQR